MTWTTPRSPANAPLVVPALKGWQTPSLPATQFVRTGSASEKSDEPPNVTAAGGASGFASVELQNGFDFLVAPTGTFESVPMPTETPAPLPLVALPPGGLRTLTKASVVPERSLRRQAWVRPAAQVVSPAVQSLAKRFFQFLMSVFRTSLAQL